MNQEELETYHLNFHQSFSPELEYLSRIVNLADANEGPLTKEEISERTMIPTGKVSGKVEPHIYYAAAMKLITFKKLEKRFICKLTPLGKKIALEDPYLVESISKLILHSFLADKHSAAIMWSYIFNELIPKVKPSFSNELIQSAVERHFSMNVNLTPFRTCYSSDLSFGDLGLIRSGDKDYYLDAHRVASENVYAYGYVLLEKWSKQLKGRSEITFDEITDVLYFGRVFLWGERQIRDALDLMQEVGLISVNAQLSPITIIKNQNSSYCLDKMYSLLI